MWKSVRLTGVLLSVAVLAGLAFVLLAPREPSYHGKPLSRWLEDLTPPSRIISTTGQPNNAPWASFQNFGAAHEQAAEAVRQMGTNAIPSLIRILRGSDVWQRDQWKLKLNTLLSKQSLLAWRASPPRSRHNSAFVALQVLGPAAIQPLAELLSDKRVNEQNRKRAADQLSELVGAQSIPALSSAVTDPNEKVREASVEALERAIDGLAFSGRQAIPILEKAMTLPNEQLRVAAAAALLTCESDNLAALLITVRHGGLASKHVAMWNLGRLRKNPELVVPALIAALDDEEGQLRESAADALTKFGTQATEAIPALRKRLDDPKKSVRIAATNALDAIQPRFARPAGVD